MSKFSLGCLKVASLFAVPIGVLLFVLSAIGGTAYGVPPIQWLIVVFLGLIGNVVCGIAEK